MDAILGCFNPYCYLALPAGDWFRLTWKGRFSSDFNMRTKCPGELDSCLNCSIRFQHLRPLIKGVIVTSRFRHDAPDFDVNLVLDCKYQYASTLHKFEASIGSSHIFRSLFDGQHVVYAVDKDYRLIFLRAFANFKAYKKFLSDKKEINHLIEKAQNNPLT
jgi:hypothetical protein